ncbi:Transposase [Popillia japonica]|uniref:Transposase n=1 Tax=Popillia japonica TaxID=7064 RepID=A0AAW1LDA9_POPJA
MPRHPGQEDITPENKGKLCALLERNVAIANIAEELNLSISQIYRWKRKFAEDENAFANGRKGVCGRKRSLSENDVNNVLNVIRERPFSSIRAIQERLHLNCCRQTIWRAMTKANYKCRRPAHKIDYDNDN